MHKEIADKLVTALRSGEYKQARSALREGNSYCCLGVLCDLYGKSQGGEWEEFTLDSDSVPHYRFYGSSGVLPMEVMQWAGMRYNNGGYGRMVDGFPEHALSHDNDSGHTFEQIANTIEAYWTQL